jgi:hypothetical protein
MYLCAVFKRNFYAIFQNNILVLFKIGIICTQNTS